MRRSYPIVILLLLSTQIALSQSVTGVWRGKLSKGLKQYSLELKLIRMGDSLTGTSYYYSGSSYARFAVKGSMSMEGDVLWWDEQLITTNGNSMAIPNRTANLFAADFNCPGDDIMKLDGSAVRKDDQGNEKPADVHLTKVIRPLFSDDWDDVIEDFPSYAAQPKLIRKIEKDQISNDKPVPNDIASNQRPHSETTIVKSEPVISAAQKPEPNVEEMFIQRQKPVVAEIPVNGDSILLRFYDHAEIDGDSIALFLNNKLLYKHILLKAEPMEIWISAKDLKDENELTMVAENLGSIPPNTSLMIAWCKGIRYEAKLESTENSSATVRLVKKPPISKSQD